MAEDGKKKKDGVEETPTEPDTEDPGKDEQVEAEQAEFMKELGVLVDTKVAEREPKEEIEEGDPPTEEPGGDEDTGDQDEGAAPKDGHEDEQGGHGDEEPVVDPALRERAVRAGLSLAEVDAVKDEGALTTIVERMESAGKKAEDDKEPSDDGPSMEDLLAAIPEFDEEDWAPETVEAFKAIKDIALAQSKYMTKQSEEIASLRETMKGLQENVATQATWADAKYADLEKGYEETFGKGNYADLPEGKEKAARDKVQRHMDFLKEDAKKEGKPLSQKGLFDKALETAFGDVVNKVKGKKLREEAEKRKARTMTQPRTTTGKFASEREDFGTGDDRKSDALAAVSELFEDA